MSPAAFAAAALAAALHFVLELGGVDGPAALATKAASVPLLALGAWLAGGRGRWLAVALLLHSAGDVLIEVAPLAAAMAAFLLGHLAYVALFLPRRALLRETALWRRLAAAYLPLHGVVLLALVLPSAGPLRAPLVVYALGLLAMAATASLARAPAWLPLGALLFVASDSLLAYDLFVQPLAIADVLVWPTYWIGQALLTVGFLAALPGAQARVASTAPPSRTAP